MEQSDNNVHIKAVIKCRPLLNREQNGQKSIKIHWKINGNTIKALSTNVNQARYTFDKIYDADATNKDLYEKEFKQIVEKFLRGINATIFAYGQSSSGKTYTLHGDKNDPGIIQLAAQQIFNEISRAEKKVAFVTRVHYVEIYNEKVYDLLNNRSELNFEKLANGFLEGKLVESEADILDLINTGNADRKIFKTNLNDRSSRSHTILQIHIRSMPGEDDRSLVSILNLVDLAGSESAEQSGATGERFTETCKINQSLLTLGLVINQLSVKQTGHISYRDSKLTQMLQNSLGGNSMTVLICTITPAEIEETNRTLGFANRAMQIQNKPVVNEVMNDAIEIEKMKIEIDSLEKKLHEQKEKLQTNDQGIKEELVAFKNFRSEISKSFSTNASLRRKFSESQNIRPSNTSVKMEVNGKSVNTPNVEKTQKESSTIQSSFSPNKNRTFSKYLINQDKDESMTSSKRTNLVVLNKDKRIEALQEELEEMRHYKQLESSKSKALQADLERKSFEVEKLNKELDVIRKRIPDSKVKSRAGSRNLQFNLHV